MSYLKRVAQGFAGIEKWEPLADILVLKIFEIVIFSNIVNFIDFTAISVFWQVNN